MKYATEQEGTPTILVLENGDSIMVRTAIGHVTADGRLPDGSPKYMVQTMTAVFVVDVIDKVRVTGR